MLAGGDTLIRVPDRIVDAFQAGDRLLVAGTAVLHVPHREHETARAAVDRACEAFARLGAIEDTAIARFYALFAARLADGAIWSRIAEANARDVEMARGRGRSTARLVADARMRSAMLEGLAQWQAMGVRRGAIVERAEHPGWEVQTVRDGLGVVGFVFEGRPNVFADATGVLNSGNTAVLRIGSDALGTARAIVAHALQPSLRDAGLPAGAVGLIDSAEHAAAWALFADPRLAIAVARGSGAAVSQLGAIARQAGTPASLHGTGGAWLIADDTAEPERFRAALFHSLDRKVCNTTNVVLLPRSRAAELAPVALEALQARGETLGHGFKLHVLPGALAHIPPDLFATRTPIARAEGAIEEPIAEELSPEELGHEWEWEATPEISLGVVETLDEAIALFNRFSPRFVASLISSEARSHERFFRAIDAPFVGDGFTRWVDGQYALQRPELGLSNWQAGRLFGRGGVLSGDGVYTLRLRVRQHDPNLHR